MIDLLVISDDFTGALDTGVQFSKQGVSTMVTTKIAIDFSTIDEEVKVLVIDTESRHLSAEAAYQLIYNIIARAKESNVPYLYKKVDSALRGNISAEIKALLDASSASVLPFLPAYPDMKRILVNGELFIDQVLVSKSIFAKDPYEPVMESNLLRRLWEEEAIESHLIQRQLQIDDFTGVLVFDAQTNEDLAEQFEQLEQRNLLSLSVGCAGFAKLLAEKLFPLVTPRKYTIEQPLVVMCGSINPITRKQLEYSEQQNHPRITLRPDQLLTKNYWYSGKGQEEIRRYLALMTNESIVLFDTFSNGMSRGMSSYRQKTGIERTELRFQIGQSLGALTKAIWEKRTENTFLFTGGDTLYQSMKVLGVNEVRPIAEISEGVVLSTIKWRGCLMQVITKSGGFGNVELFEKISQLAEKTCRHINKN